MADPRGEGVSGGLGGGGGVSVNLNIDQNFKNDTQTVLGHSSSKNYIVKHTCINIRCPQLGL